MKISVAIPCYNHGKYVRQAILSAVNQTHKDIEVLVCDDGSTDNSRKEIESVCDSRVSLRVHQTNQGFPLAFKNCFQRATGDLFCGLGADDWYSDLRFFEKAVEKIGDSGGVYGYTEILNKGQQDTYGGLCGLGEEVGLIGPDKFLAGFLGRKNFVPGYSCIWRMSHIKAIGGYPYDLGPQADLFVNHAIPSRFGVVFSNEVFSSTRQYGDNYSRSGTDEEQIIRHAIFEKKMRESTGNKMSDLWIGWRENVIKSIMPNDQYAGRMLFNKWVEQQ